MNDYILAIFSITNSYSIFFLFKNIDVTLWIVTRNNHEPKYSEWKIWNILYGNKLFTVLSLVFTDELRIYRHFIEVLLKQQLMSKYTENLIIHKWLYILLFWVFFLLRSDYFKYYTATYIIIDTISFFYTLLKRCNAQIFYIATEKKRILYRNHIFHKVTYLIFSKTSINLTENNMNI